jgi:hypothetical protein
MNGIHTRKTQPKLRDLRDSGLYSTKNRRPGLNFSSNEPETDYQAVTPPEPSVLKKPLKTVEFLDVKSSEFAANAEQ